MAQPTPAPPAASAEPTPTATPSRLLHFSDGSLELSFDYPKEWGTVSVTTEEQQCFAKGEGHRLRFADQPEIGATVRSSDYRWSQACARGGAYWDSPALFIEMAAFTDRAWDPVAFEGRWVIERSPTRLIAADCSSFVNFAGLDGWAKPGGLRFDVVHIYQRIRDGSHLDGCERGLDFFAAVTPDFTAVVRSVKTPAA